LADPVQDDGDLLATLGGGRRAVLEPLGTPALDEGEEIHGGVRLEFFQAEALGRTPGDAGTRTAAAGARPEGDTQGQSGK
jgi:hypothetical protein